MHDTILILILMKYLNGQNYPCLFHIKTKILTTETKAINEPIYLTTHLIPAQLNSSQTRTCHYKNPLIIVETLEIIK